MLCLASTRQVFAVTDVIGDFCAGPVAKADPEAVKQCAEYAQSLIDSSVKKVEKDENTYNE